MRVIFVNRFYFPDQSATAQLLTDLAEHLGKQPVAVFVIASRQLYERADAALANRETVRGVTALRVWTTSFGRSNLVGRALDYATFYASALLRLMCLVTRRDVVLAMTDPPLVSVVVTIAAKVRGARVINWNHDVFPEVAQAAGMRLARDLLGRALIALRNWSWREANCNVAVGAAMGEYMEAQGISRERIRVIENWSDGSLIKPLSRERNRLRAAWGLTGMFVVGYAGNLGVAHETGAVFEAIKRLDNDASVRFLFIGGGSRYLALKAAVERAGLRNASFKPYVLKDQLPLSLTLPDAHLITLRPGMERFVVPSKLYAVLAAGRPAIYVGPQDGEVARVINEFDCGRVVPPGDGAALADCIQRLRSDKRVQQALGQRARLAFEQRFDKPLALARWERLINQVSEA